MWRGFPAKVRSFKLTLGSGKTLGVLKQNIQKQKAECNQSASLEWGKGDRESSQEANEVRCEVIRFLNKGG